MWFHFSSFNHDPVGRTSLVDLAAWFEAGLIDLGHKVTFSDRQVEPGAINLFWECFHPGMASQIRETGVKFGIIATEIPDGIAFNWRKEPQWKERFDAFLEVVEGASFIWAMAESTVPFYARFCPTAFMELGFSDRLIPHYINAKPEFDFSFFGIRTPYRMEAVERVRKYAKVEWPKKFLSADEVGVLIGKTKIGLNFKQSERWPVPSPTRLGRLMMAKRDIASERTEVATRQGEIVGLAPAGQDFVDFALERLNGDWRQRAERVFEDYRDQMPMCDIMDAVLERTVSKLATSDSRKEAIHIAPFVPPPVLVRSMGDWNIVHWEGQYYALLKGLGSVDVREGIDALQARYGKRSVLRAGRRRWILAKILICGPWRNCSPARVKRLLQRLFGSG
jgi:hypothetical protein